MGRSHPTYKSSTMKHNNMIANEHFKKYWQRYVKTWFDQPAKKKARRLARQKKAAAVAPRPVAGALRSVVHPPTQRYNSKVRIGRGFSLAEIKAVGLGKREAKSLGIAVDHRRRNKSVEGQEANVQRLRDYRSKLVVFPKHAAHKRKDGLPLLRPTLLSNSSLVRLCPSCQRARSQRPAQSLPRRPALTLSACSRLCAMMLVLRDTVRCNKRSRLTRPNKTASRRLSKSAKDDVFDSIAKFDRPCCGIKLG